MKNTVIVKREHLDVVLGSFWLKATEDETIDLYKSLDKQRIYAESRKEETEQDQVNSILDGIEEQLREKGIITAKTKSILG